MEPEVPDYRIPFEREKDWQEHLKKEGFVVIANYLPRVECEAYVGTAWDIMEHLAQGKLKRGDR